MIEVHHLENSRSIRIPWLLEELGAPYTVVTYKRDPKTRAAPPELRNVHFTGKSPVIVDKSVDPPLVVAESGAIFEYLLDKYSKNNRLIPERGSAAWRKYLFWMHASEGSFAPPITMKVMFSEVPISVKEKFDKFASYALDPTIKTFANYIEAELLAPQEYITGNAFTAADIILYQTVVTADIFVPGVIGPSTRAWIKRLRARPAFQAIKKLEFAGAWIRDVKNSKL
ncbi:hypothetical protein HK100_001982 [Physocladia obscura]|uniref:glutathione transferase n=1 Tax=Physocladia obscura TaxID=109957 RepID=A0AAD5T877_9FUNG|nr:hypothetical protein HK100_001982 [Physocladia obscura]